MTQERSRVIRETEENPFGDDEEEEARMAAQQQAAAASSSKPSTASSMAHHRSGSGVPGSSLFGSSKDSKKSKSRSKRKAFNFEAEKEQMKAVIADSSISSTSLMNLLQTINRETERISENPKAVEQFEICKQLRRRVLRYVRPASHPLSLPRPAPYPTIAR